MSRHLIILTAAAVSACSAAMQPSDASLNQTSISQSVAPRPVDPQAFAESLTPDSPVQSAPAEPARLPDEPLAGAQLTRRSSCDIVVQPTSHGIRLKAVARMAYPVSGHYSMVVTKRGRSGSSDITQGGPFKSSGEKDVSLSSAELSVEEASHYRAVLTLHVNDRQVCRSEIRS
jgi:hypothetical protein